MITQGAGNVDLAAVAADEALLDLLAARAVVPADDVLAGLLAAFADEVDDGLAALLADAEGDLSVRPSPVAVPAVSIVPDLPAAPGRRSHGLRVTTVALVVGATLSVSGVAAAVTGDPFAPYRGLVSAVTGGHDESAAQAARTAWLQRQLASTRAKLGHGDLADAGADLTRMRARLAATEGLSRGRRTALEARIGALEATLARATAAATEDASGQPKDRVKDRVKDHGTPAGGVVTPAPQDAARDEPRSSGSPEPQSSRAHQPQDTKVHRPQNTKTPEPQNTKQVTAQPSTTAAPQDTGRQRPDNTKKATPPSSTSEETQASAAAQPTHGNSPGSANADR